MKILSTIILIVINLTASGFYEIDTKASSIGGAGLTSSSYFNPAVLAGSKKIDFSFKMGAELKTDAQSIDLLKDIKDLANPKNIGFNTATTNLVDSITLPLGNINTLLKLNNNEKIKLNLSDKDASTIKDAKRIIKNANNIAIDVASGLGVNLNIKNYSLAYVQVVSFDFVPQINSDKLDIIKDVTIANQKKYIKVNLDAKEMSQTTKLDYDNNSLFVGKEELANSSIDIKVASLMELPFMYSYRHNINYRSYLDGHLNLGLSMKYMSLKKETITISSKDGVNPSKYINKILDSKSYNSGSLDFGLLYYPKILSGFKTGIVFKNITSPKFDDKTLEPMIRYGLAFSKYNMHTALDFDITKNKTLSGRETQIIGGGIGYNPLSWLGANIGFKQDLANKDLGTILTTGLNLPLVKLSAQFSNDKFYQFQFNLNI